MLKYSSHAVYCGLLCVLLSRFEAAGADALLLWFLRIFVSWNVAALLAAVFVFDLNGVRYSEMSVDGGVRVRDAVHVVLYAVALAANIGACTAAACALRIAFGFSLQMEIGASTLVLLLYNGANLRYNAESFKRLEPFWIGKGLDLAKHQAWSFALSNVGLTFRLYKRVLLYALSTLLWPTVPTLGDLLPTWHYPTAWAYVAVVLLTPLTLGFTFVQYHLAHQWLHASAALYRTVHKVHHLSRYPIPSDSGTISPLEFALHEITAPKVVSPFWFWLPGEIFIGMQHRKDHTFELGNKDLQEGKGDAAWHMLHHSKNTGNYSFEPVDKLFGTAMDLSKIAPFVLG